VHKRTGFSPSVWLPCSARHKLPRPFPWSSVALSTTHWGILFHRHQACWAKTWDDRQDRHRQTACANPYWSPLNEPHHSNVTVHSDFRLFLIQIVIPNLNILSSIRNHRTICPYRRRGLVISCVRKFVCRSVCVSVCPRSRMKTARAINSNVGEDISHDRP